MTQPRLVLDTNVLVSAFLWQGQPGRLIEMAGEKEVRLFSSRPLLEELEATLTKKKLSKYVAATGSTPAQLLGAYKRLCTIVTAQQLSTRVSRDADDDVVLACAIAAKADFVVSGDDDLLVLSSFQGISILTVSDALKRLRSPAG